MLKNAKLILTALAILAAAAIIFVIVGFVIWALQILFVIAIVLFIAFMVRKLSGKSKRHEIEEKDSDRELNEAIRQLEEIKRKQLVR
ncbi:MAG TPA: hypothetical protein VKB86_17655 [Pyrinomonadaceae bacterium]|nr:hypothetical protein [Pyrinomonadaceae bacterium]